MGKKNTQPAKKPAKVPVVMQMEELECGAASLAMVMAFYEKWIPLEKLRVDSGVSRDGSNAKNLLRAARMHGFQAEGYRLEPAELQKIDCFPCIIHWNFNHFVVLKGFKKGRACLNDPAQGPITVSMEEFNRAFTGICLMIRPGEDFQPGGKRESVVQFAVRRLKGTGAAILFVALTSLIMVLIGIIRPGFARIFMDRILTQENPEWIYPLLIGLTIVSLIQFVAAGIQTVYSNRISAKMDALGNMTFLWKVLHLPMEFFAQRTASDIQTRQNANSTIVRNLVYTLAPLLLNLALMVFYLVVMIRYSWVMALVGVSSVVINTVVSRIVAQKQVDMARVQMWDQAKLSAATITGIDMIETIKVSGSEHDYFERWSGFQAKVNAKKEAFLRDNLYLTLLPELVAGLTNTIVMMMGVFAAMKGQFTVGMIMAFQGFLHAFEAPALSLIAAGQTITEMRTSMERVEDVMRYPSDVYFDTNGEEKPQNESFAKLTGNVEMKHVTFGYSKLAQPLIRDFSLTLTPGKRIALVGASGCGKSTIARLLSGLYQPWSGEILFDGKTIPQIDRSIFTGSLLVVEQDVVLFEDTIANNIKMWDDSIEDFEMILAARDAQIHDEIMQREGGYHYRVSEGGRDFSGGQRQRIEIARVLAQDPTIVILDEATSALDAKTELNVMNAIKARGVTCVVVAHRLSTIRDCDEILVLEQGVVVERGKHEELMAQQGVYWNLITNA